MIKGGYIEKEANLSQEGDAQVYGDARVYYHVWVLLSLTLLNNDPIFEMHKVMNELKEV